MHWAIWYIFFFMLGYAKAFYQCGWVQVESRCGHMSIAWLGQSVQLGLGYVTAKICSFGGIPCIGRIKNLRFV